MSTDSFMELVDRVAALAQRAIAGVVTCGITLADGDRVLTVACADELAALLDEQQYEHGAGPCLSALDTGEIVDAPDLSVESRWGDYPGIAMGHGVMSVYSVPLLVEDKPVGVLNLYGGQARMFGAAQRERAELVAGQATIAVTAALRHYDEVSLTDHLRTALASRSVIDQAIGIVMAQCRCTPQEAFGMLRALSQRRHIKIRALAAELVTATATGLAHPDLSSGGAWPGVTEPGVG